MIDDSTQSGTPLTLAGNRDGADDASALIVAWSRDEPGRVGEVLPLPSRSSTTPHVFGRGLPAAGERRQALALFRQRPGLFEATGPLLAPRISRRQLELAFEDKRPVVRNVGKCPLLHNGIETDESDLLTGDVIEIQNELLLLCVQRAPWWPPFPEDMAFTSHPFGAADVNGIVGESPATWELR